MSQAPGARVHASGIPFDDPSGDRLRSWLGIDEPTFHDATQIAIVPVAFCYPGKGAAGDLPPRPECAPTWHPQLMPLLADIRLTILVGGYATRHMLGKHDAPTLTEACRQWRQHRARGYLPLPHPSGRNRAWFRRNPWFAEEVLPQLKSDVAHALQKGAGSRSGKL